MSKIHLAVSTLPLDAGETIEAVCGALIPKAQLMHIPSPDAEMLLTESPSTILLCRRCFQSRYHYLICSGDFAHFEPALALEGVEA